MMETASYVCAHTHTRTICERAWQDAACGRGHRDGRGSRPTEQDREVSGDGKGTRKDLDHICACTTHPRPASGGGGETARAAPRHAPKSPDTPQPCSARPLQDRLGPHRPGGLQLARASSNAARWRRCSKHVNILNILSVANYFFSKYFTCTNFKCKYFKQSARPLRTHRYRSAGQSKGGFSTVNNLSQCDRTALRFP